MPGLARQAAGGLHTDFKSRVGTLGELAKDLVCFANTDGGRLLIGVADEGVVVGVDDPEAVHRDVDNVALNNCEPPVTVVQEVLELDGKQVVVVQVPKGDQRPYRTNKGRYFVRTTTGCRDASQEELLRLFQAAESLYYDETPMPRLGLKLHLPIPHEIRGFEPEPKPELPAPALREAIVNAVAHRDYTIRGPIRLFILDDRIEIHTPGKPPNSVDADAMRAGVHVVRNPRIYARLSDAGLTTRAGSGIRRMIRLVREATGRDVEIDVRDFEVLVTIPRKSAS